jgi:hypothetical protein
MTETKTIAETNRFIVLDRYDKDTKAILLRRDECPAPI